MIKGKKKGKGGRPTNKVLAQRKTEAKRKADAIINEISLGNVVNNGSGNVTETLVKKEVITENSGSGWLENEVTRLTSEVESLENKLVEKTNDYTRVNNEFITLKQSGTNTKVPSQSDSEIKNAVRKIFNDLNNNYLGKNKEQIKWPEIQMLPFLERMLGEFPFLREKR